MEQYVTRIGDVTIQRVIPSGGGPPEPVRVMDGEELLRAVKEEPIDEDEEEGEDETREEEMEGEEETHMEREEGEGGEGDGDGEVVDEKAEQKEDQDPEEEEPEEEELDDEVEKIIIKAEPQDQDELLGEGVETEQPVEDEINEDGEQHTEAKEHEDDQTLDQEKTDEFDDEKDQDQGETTKRKAGNDTEEDDESSSKKKKVEMDVDLDKKKISNLRRNIREVMDETQLDEATLAAQRQEAERLRRVQDQQKYIREVQRQIQLNRQNSKTQSRVISLLQGGSTSILKSSSSGSTTTATSTGPSTVLVKVGSGQQQVLNRKTLEVLRGGKSLNSSAEQIRSGIARVTPGNKPSMVTPSVSIAPVKPVIQGEAHKKVAPNDTEVVTISSSSDSEDDCIVISEGEEDEEEEEEEDVDPTNSGMHTNDLYNIPDEQGRVLINVGKPEDEHDIFLAPQIARVIKPHQIGGVRFLFDNVVESIERFNNSTGFGCILAHSMGLGKTLQVVSFCDVFLRETSARTVMCIMPINTLQNWVAEFNMWLPTDPSTSLLAVHGEVRPRHFGIYVLNDLNKTVSSRAKVVEEWNREGGVLLIGYEMYRQLSLKRAARVRKGKKKQQVEEEVDDEKNKPLLEAMHEALVKPGPDLVICDEGHRIKNSHASISHALKQIRTKRRVVLTGYPLQNNLLEYWCMVDFVRPNYLGTKTEFSNMFERPIQNGQCIDSTPQDIRLMRYRAHVLHSLLEGFVQRRSHSVLRNSLPQKEEYVLLVRMTPLQRKLYDTFMNEVVRTKAVPNPLKAFAVCCKIWNHPDILYNFLKKKELDELQDLDLEETAALQQQPAGPNSPRRPLAKEKRGKKEVKKAQVAPIKAEVTSQPQSQPQTPDMKPEDRKFDFPNPGQSGAPGYDYYPPPPYPDAYQYHRPPGVYYPGYYQEGPPSGPPFYHHPNPPHGYEQTGYSGYYPNYEAPYPPKGEDFGKQPWNSPPFSSPNIKQEKNQTKSPKEHDTPQKPGYQEFYGVNKEEKPDIKEEKQTFLRGFSGGQVSYNYSNMPGGYPNYPYPPNEFPGWNKGGVFPQFPPGEPGIHGGQGPSSGNHPAPGNPGSQPGMFSNQSDGQHRPHPNQERSHSVQPGPQHSGLDRNQHNQNPGPDSHLSSLGKDNQHRHGGQDRQHNSQEMMHGNYMNPSMNQKGSEHVQKQTEYGNKKHDSSSEIPQRNQDTGMKNRNQQENDPKHMQNTNLPPNQQGLFNPHQHYGSRSQQEEYRIPFGSPDRQGSGLQNQHDNQNMHSSPGNKNNQHPQFSGQQAPSDHQKHGHGNADQNTSHIPNPYNSQRNDHSLRGSSDHMMSLQNETERMSGAHSGMFLNQENQSSHDHSNRQYGNPENFTSNQKNMYGNKRNEHHFPGNQDHGNHPNLMGGQPLQEHSRRPSLGHENIHPQGNVYNNQRNDNASHGFQDHGVVNQQNSPAAQDKYENRNRLHSSQERHMGAQQNFVNQKNENESQLNPKHPAQQNVGMLSNQEQMPPNNQNLGMMPGPSHNMYANQDPSEQPSNQHSAYRGQNQHDGQQRGHSNYYPQFDGSVSSRQDHMQSQQANINQNVQQNQKRISNAENTSGMQQSMYPNQSDHSVQKMIRNEPHLENHQMMQSNQERPPSQYNTYSSSENIFHNQHAHQASHESNSQNPVEKQNIQELQQVNRERMMGSQGGHSNQERQTGSSTAMFKNPNSSDIRWHGNSDRSLNQQNTFDQSQHSKDNDPHTNKDKQSFHSSQDYSSHGQQNVFSGQNNQALHRNSELHGKHQGIGHENQYRMGKDRNHGQERSTGMMSGIELKSNVQDSGQNSSQMHNPHEHPHNNNPHQQMPRNISHSNQEQMHNMMGHKSVPHGNSDHPHAGINTQGITSNPDGSQSISAMPNYNLQSSPQQNHVSNQHNMQGNQNANRSHHGQEPGSNHSYSDNQHNMYGNQYNMQSDHPSNIQNIHGNQHMKNHASSQQPGQNMQMHGGNPLPQGTAGIQGMSMSQNQGFHSLSQNQSQGHSPMSQGQPAAPTQSGHGSSANQYQSGSAPMNLGQHGSMSVNQGQHGSMSMSQGQHGSVSMNPGQHGSTPTNQGQHGNQFQPHMNPQQYPSNNPYHNTDQSMIGNKDQNNPSSNNQGTPYSGSHHGNQYMPTPNHPNSSHGMHPEHMLGNQNTSKMSHSQHSMANQASMHNKPPTTPTKNDYQKMQMSPMSHLPPPSPHHPQNTNANQLVNQQGTQTAVDNAGQISGSQHRIQNMLGFQAGQPQGVPFEQNIITSSKGMSGGQVLQGTHQQKHSMHNVLGKNDDQNRFRSNFNEPFAPNSDNYQKPGFYGQDFQYPYQGQYPEQPGPSGQMYRKEDDKSNEGNKQKEFDKKSHPDNDENLKTNTTSTSTETEEDKEKRERKDEEEKGEKKLEARVETTTTTTPKSGKEDPGIPYDWATELLKGYTPGDIHSSAKMAVFFCILEESIALGDRILVFSQSLFTLNLMEELLQQQFVPGRNDERWAKNTNYYRLDGSTTAMEREKLINEFNSNANLHLFLVSTRAGSLGINLVGANRVIVFDASWNPCHDTQAVCRVYRYGQKKPCFVYRLVTDNCLEKKIYDRQINKQGMSDRVVDECNPDAHLSIKEVTSLCWDDKEDDVTPKDFTSLQDQYIDVVLQKVIQRHSLQLSKEPFAHESLLVDRKEKKLSQAEKRLAKRSYELEKQASTRPMYNGINQNQVRPKPMASVRPMQAEMGQAGRQRGWIPASVWQRQGMSAQEMTLPLDVVIPTNAADRASIVLKAGQKVMVLKSPKGIYMQLENGKIIAIRTAFKVGGKKPGETGKAGPAELAQRRGLRQIGTVRGRPVRAVGPVTRPPPVTVTVTKKRLSEDDGRKEESEGSENTQPTPMEVSETSSAEKEEKSDTDIPNPFTAAAAASLSSMQVSQSEEEQKQMETLEQAIQMSEKMHTSPNPVLSQPHTPQPSPQLQKPPTPVPVQPQVPMSPQPQAPVQPLSAKPLSTHPQVTVQPIVKSPVHNQAPSSHSSVQHPISSQKHSQVPVQPQIPVPIQQQMHMPMEIPTPMQNRSAIHMQHPSQQSMQTQSNLHTQPVQPQPSYSSQGQTPPHTPIPGHLQSHSQGSPSLQNHPPTSIPNQTQSSSSMIPHPQISSSMQTQSHSSGSIHSQPHSSTSHQTQSHSSSSMQTQSHSSVSHSSASMQAHPQTTNSMTHSHASTSMQTDTQSSPSLQSHTQTSSLVPTHSQVSTPLQPQPPISLHPHFPIPSHPQAPFAMQQTPHHPHSSPYPMQSQQKSTHFPNMPPHQFPLPPQQGQYHMPPQQSQFLGHPTHQSFPMHPQPQYPLHPQQPYPVQPHPQYPLQPHLQQPQYSGQPPHQFPLHPQPQFPLQSPSQFDQPAPPVPSSMMTDHLS